MFSQCVCVCVRLVVEALGAPSRETPPGADPPGASQHNGSGLDSATTTLPTTLRPGPAPPPSRGLRGPLARCGRRDADVERGGSRPALVLGGGGSDGCSGARVVEDASPAASPNVADGGTMSRDEQETRVHWVDPAMRPRGGAARVCLCNSGCNCNVASRASPLVPALVMQLRIMSRAPPRALCPQTLPVGRAGWRPTRRRRPIGPRHCAALVSVLALGKNMAQRYSFPQQARHRPAVPLHARLTPDLEGWIHTWQVSASAASALACLFCTCAIL